MSASVPEERVDIVLADGSADVTAATRAVRSVSWVDAATLQCWLAGRGSVDVPAHHTGRTIPNNAGAEAFYYRTKPRYQTTRYAYTIVLTTPDASGFSAKVQIPAGGSAHTVPVTTRGAVRAPTTILIDRASQSSAEVELSLDVDPDGNGDVTVESVSVEAVPRSILSTSSDDLGADRLTFWIRQPIMAPTLVTQILDRQNDLRDAARRIGLFQFSRGTSSPWTTTSGTAVDLFDGPVPIVPRRVIPTIYTASLRILAKCSNGTTAGEFEIANPTDSATVTIPAGTTSWTWLPSTAGSPADFDIPSEDPSEATGLASGLAEYQHTMTFHRTAGQGSVQIASISVFDAAQ